MDTCLYNIIESLDKKKRYTNNGMFYIKKEAITNLNRFSEADD